MRILLIQPPYDLHDDDERQAMPPLGLAQIAAVLEREGHEVRIIDCVVEDFDRLTPLPDGRRRHGLSDDELKAEIAAFRPGLVGVSCLFSAQYTAAHHACALVKQVVPEAVTVMGGAHPSAVPEEVVADPNVDLAAIGEGEMTVLRLVRAIEAGRRWPEDPSGLAFRRDDGSVSVNRPSTFLTDLDALPLPARHLLPMKSYFAYRSPHGAVVKRHPVTNMITSRGCPAQCSFCSIHTVWGRKFRWNGTQRVIQEIEHLVGDYGVKEIQFEDDNLTLHKPRMKEICQAIIDRKIDLTWTNPNGLAIWAMDEEMLALMRASGCYHVTVAVESGSQEVLRKIINKPLDLKRVHPIVTAARKLGMGVSAFFVVGFPGETKDDLAKTFDFGMNMGADQVHFFTATPYPGTALFNQCVADGLLRTPVDYTQLRVGRPIISTQHWTADELCEMTRAAQARFYRRTALRHPLRSFSTVVHKFAREPVVTFKKLWDNLLPRVPPATRRSADKPVEPTVSAGFSLPVLQA